jgi:precorrin-4 methylase
VKIEQGQREITFLHAGDPSIFQAMQTKAYDFLS